jgi:hypothetical protein
MKRLQVKGLSLLEVKKVQAFTGWKLKNLAFNSYSKEKLFLSNS